MMFILLLTKIILCDQNKFNELRGLLGAFNSLLENELKKSMLDSPDHCEATLEKMNKKDESETQNDESKLDSGTIKRADTILEELKKIRAKRAQRYSSSSSTEDENMKRDKIVGLTLQNKIDAYNLKDRIFDKLKDKEEKNKHQHKKEDDDIVVQGKPRKIKMVKLVKVPVDENGEEIK